MFQYFIGLTALEALDLIQNGDLSDIDIDGWSDDDINDSVPDINPVAHVNNSDDETDSEATTDIPQQQEAKKKNIKTYFTLHGRYL